MHGLEFILTTRRVLALEIASLCIGCVFLAEGLLEQVLDGEAQRFEVRGALSATILFANRATCDQFTCEWSYHAICECSTPTASDNQRRDKENYDALCHRTMSFPY